MPSLIIKELNNKEEVKKEAKVVKEIGKGLKRINKYT
jgi:hypothetical protein